MNTKGPLGIRMYARGLADEIVEAQGMAEKIKQQGWRPVAVRPAEVGDVIWSDAAGPIRVETPNSWITGLVSLILERIPSAEVPAPSIAGHPGMAPLTIPYEVADAVFKAGYRVDRLGWVEAGDIVWRKSQPWTVMVSDQFVGAWSLIIKPLTPPPVREPKGQLYVEPWGDSHLKIGLTLDHYLLVSRDEAIYLQAAVGQLLFERGRS